MIADYISGNEKQSRITEVIEKIKQAKEKGMNIGSNLRSFSPMTRMNTYNDKIMQMYPEFMVSIYLTLKVIQNKLKSPEKHQKEKKVEICHDDKMYKIKQDFNKMNKDFKNRSKAFDLLKGIFAKT